MVRLSEDVPAGRAAASVSPRCASRTGGGVPRVRSPSGTARVSRLSAHVSHALVDGLANAGYGTAEYCEPGEEVESIVEKHQIEAMETSNNTENCITIPQAHFYFGFSWWVSGIATLITGCLGIVGNLLSLTVLCKK